MPFYYTGNRVTATHATPGTLTTHMRFLTVASQRMARIMAIYGAIRSTTAGGALLKLIRPGAAGSGGTSATLAKCHPDFPTAETTALDDASAITAGTSPVTKQIAGIAQSGGTGGWQAGELDEGEAMKANGGANGNLEIGSLSITASQTLDFTVKLRED